MFKTLKNSWRIPELKNKLLFTLLIVILYRLGSAIPVPYVNATNLGMSTAFQGNIFEFLNILSGSALSQGTLFALGVSPYITASIVMQLLTIAIPYFERKSKEGEEGRKKISALTRYATLAISLLMAIGFTLNIRGALTDNNFISYLFVILTVVAGSMLTMWLGEQITENGIGNGISMLIFVGIVSRIVPAAIGLVKNVVGGAFGWWWLPIILVGVVFIFAAIVFMALIVGAMHGIIARACVPIVAF